MHTAVMILYESPRFSLRNFRVNDAPSFSAHANDPTIARFMSDQFPHPYSRAQAEKFIAKAIELKHLFFAISINDEAVGAIGIHPLTDVYRMNAELGYWIGKKWQGQGILSEALPQICAYSWKNLELLRLFARPFGSNTASQRVLEKSNFQLDTRIKGNLIKNGQVEDECIYSIRSPNFADKF